MTNRLNVLEAMEWHRGRNTAVKILMGLQPWFGFDIKPAAGGLKIAGIKPGSPADEAGFKNNDLVVEAAGVIIKSAADFRNALKQKKMGEFVDVSVMRAEGKAAPHKVTATLGLRTVVFTVEELARLQRIAAGTLRETPKDNDIDFADRMDRRAHTYATTGTVVIEEEEEEEVSPAPAPTAASLSTSTSSLSSATSTSTSTSTSASTSAAPAAASAASAPAAPAQKQGHESDDEGDLPSPPTRPRVTSLVSGFVPVQAEVPLPPPAPEVDSDEEGYVAPPPPPPQPQPQPAQAMYEEAEEEALNDDLPPPPAAPIF